MNVVYFSHVGNTKRFVENHLFPLLKSRPVVLPEEEGEALRRGPVMTRLVSPGPHSTKNSGAEMSPREIVPDEATIIVFPAYPRTDHETGELIDTVPNVVKEFLSHQKPYRITGAVVCGNRTFGKKFGYVDPEELGSIPILARVEMSGTHAEAVEVREALLGLANDPERKVFKK